MRVIVVGGGPSGMLAAGRAGSEGHQVILLEKNDQLGKKLLLTGGGRCNFTLAQHDNRQLSESYGPEGKHLLSAFSRFPVQATLEFFQTRGLAYKMEDRLRLFPQSDSAQSILEILLGFLQETQVEIRTGVTVQGWIMKDGHPQGLETSQGPLHGDKFILATGGISRPETGSTGDGFRLLKSLGHRVRPPNPSLVPVVLQDPWIGNLQGLSLEEAAVGVFQGEKKLFSQKGELLFTHFGLSGPVVLNSSAKIAALIQSKPEEIFLALDLWPAFTMEALEQDFMEQIRRHPGKQVQALLGTHFPSRLTLQLFELTAIDPHKPMNQLTKGERGLLVRRIKHFPLRFHSLRSASRAINSTGGIAPAEVDFRTMQSRLEPRVCITGDLLDFDRPTGGYSLQLCWTSGWLAGHTP